MANYTVELREIIDSGINIFAFNYPFYDEKKRAEFEEKFKRHFYFREIGCETPDRFMFYLQEKMLTVFPYYNKLFETATIDYEITDNYKLTETYTRNVENKGQSSGVSSTVGQMFDKQENEVNQNKTVDTTGQGTQNETSVSDNLNAETVESQSEKEQLLNGTTTKKITGSNDTTTHNLKKYLDTPQGLINLTDSKYLTNITQDDGTNNQNIISNENGTNQQTTTETGNGTTATSGTSTSNNERNVTDTTTGKEETVDAVKGASSQEQRTTHDNNTRQYTTGEQKEEYTIVRKGNIGVDTDSDVIQKHIKLQKVLTQIELMFFNECEDLFMLVF